MRTIDYGAFSRNTFASNVSIVFRPSVLSVCSSRAAGPACAPTVRAEKKSAACVEIRVGRRRAP